MALAGVLVAAHDPPLAAAGAARPAPPAVVVDATGREVGWIVRLGDTAEGQATLLVRSGDVAVLVSATGERVTSGTSDVVFEDGNCAGSPLVVAPDPPTGFRPLFRASGVGPPNTLLVGDGPPASRPINSRWRSSSVPGTCLGVAGVPTDVQPATPILDLSTLVAPLTVR